MRVGLLTLGIFVLASGAMAQNDWEAALKKAKAEGKFVLAYFTDPECFPCQRYANQTVDNPTLAAWLRRFVVVKLDINREKERLKNWVPSWVMPGTDEGLMPVTVITDSKGKVVDYVIGHLDAGAFAAYLKAFLQGKRSDTIERRLKEKPNDLLTLYEAAVWFLERGNGQRGLPLAQKVLKLDAKNQKGYHAPMRLHLGLYYATHHVRQAHLAIDEFQAVINRFPNSREAEEARFYLATTHLALGQDAQARKWLNEIVRTGKSTLLREHAKKLLRFLDTEPPADLRRGDEEQ